MLFAHFFDVGIKNLLIKFKYYATIITFCLLSSCALWGPTYVKPSVNTPTNWPNQLTSSTKISQNAHLPELAWWQQFDAPELDELIQQALNNNNDVNIAVANVEYAQGELKQIELNWIPGLSVLGGYSQMPTLGDPLYFVGAIPMYTLNIFQQIKLQESAEYQVEASIYAKDSVRLAVIGQVASAYFAVLAETRALALYNQLLQDNQKLLRLYQSQYRSGIIAYDDVEKLNSEIEQIQAQIAITEHNIVVSKNALHFLLNQNPGNLMLNKSFEQIDSNKIIPGSLPATVLEDRPDVREAEAALKVANADVGVVTTSLIPTVRLDMFLNYRTSTHVYEKLKEATMNIPVVSASTLGEISAAEAEYKAAYIAYIKTIRAAFRDVDNDLSGYSAYSRQLSKDNEAFIHEQKNCFLVDSRFRHGVDSDLSVTECQIRLDQFALMLNQNKFEKMMTIVTLYQDLGGGYHHQSST